MIQRDTYFHQSQAVVIGINQYPNIPQARLISAVPDAWKVAETLYINQGFDHVWLFINPKGDSFGKLFKWMIKGAKPTQPLFRVEARNRFSKPADTGTIFRQRPDEMDQIYHFSRGGFLSNLISPSEEDKKPHSFLFYYAAHGQAGKMDEGPAGFLFPSDIQDNGIISGKLPMEDLYTALNGVDEQHHTLLILDCCFAGKFRHAASRSRFFEEVDSLPFTEERFNRFLRKKAWQVLVSAGPDQTAADWIGERGENALVNGLSPFADAFTQALATGKADTRAEGEVQADGVLTASELRLHLFNQVEKRTRENTHVKIQHPDLFRMGPHEGGEFFFLNPEASVIKFATWLSKNRNPYKGLLPFQEEDWPVFLGRREAIKEAEEKLEKSNVLVISGASAQGKSSLVQAGLFPKFTRKGYTKHVLKPSLRPFSGGRVSSEKEETPDLIQWLGIEELGQILLDSEGRLIPDQKHILFIDSYESFFREEYRYPFVQRKTLAPGEKSLTEFQAFEEELKRLLDALFVEKSSLTENTSVSLRVVIAIRSDYEWQFDQSQVGQHLKSYSKDNQFNPKGTYPFRYRLAPMGLDELQEALVGPGLIRDFEFESEALIGEILEELSYAPAALTLLSITMQQLFSLTENLVKEGKQHEKVFTRNTYIKTLGGVSGALSHHAENIYNQELDKAQQRVLRKIMLRMVQLNGGEFARSKIVYRPNDESKHELHYSDVDFNRLREQVIEIFTEEHLFVRGKDQETQLTTVEPAHDALINHWPRCRQWLEKYGRDNILLHAQLWQAVLDQNQFSQDFASAVGNRDRRAEELPQPSIAEDFLTQLWDSNPKLIQIILQLFEQEHDDSEHDKLTFHLKAWRDSLSPEERKIQEVLIELLNIGEETDTEEWIDDIGSGVLPPPFSIPSEATNITVEPLPDGGSVQRGELPNGGVITITENPIGTFEIFVRLPDGQEFRQKVQQPPRTEELPHVVPVPANIDAFIKNSSLLELLPVKVIEHLLKFGEHNYNSAEIEFIIASWKRRQGRIAELLRQQQILKEALEKAEARALAQEIKSLPRKLLPQSVRLGEYVWDQFISEETPPPSEETLLPPLAIQGALTEQFCLQASSEVYPIAQPFPKKNFFPRSHVTFATAYNEGIEKRILTTLANGTAKIWDSTGQELATLNGHGASIVKAMTHSTQEIITISKDGTAKLWDQNGKLIHSYKGHTDELQDMDIGFLRLEERSEPVLATASKDNHICIWSLGPSKRIIGKLLDHGGAVHSIRWMGDNSRILLSASNDGTARLWSFHEGRFTSEPLDHPGSVLFIDTSADHSTILTVSEEIARLWDKDRTLLTTIELKGEVLGHSRHRSKITFGGLSPDGTYIVTCSDDTTAILWDRQGRQLHVFRDHTDILTSAGFSADGSKLVTTSRDRIIRIWNTTTGELQARLKGHTSEITGAVFISLPITLFDDPFSKPSSEDHFSIPGVLSWDSNHTAKIWDLEGEGMFWMKNGPQKPRFAPQGNKWLTIHGNKVIVKEIGEKINKRELALRHNSNISHATFSHDGLWMASCSEDGRVKVWLVKPLEFGFNVRKAELGPLLEWDANNGPLSCVEFSAHRFPDNKNTYHLMTGSEGGIADLWELNLDPNSSLTHSKLVTFSGHHSAIRQASFAPKNLYIVTGSQDHSAKIWNLQGNLIQTLDGHFNPIPIDPHWDQKSDAQKKNEGDMDRKAQFIKKICISPDGQYLLLLPNLGNPSLWKVDTDSLQASRITYVGGPWRGERYTDAVFFPQGDSFITSSWDHSLRIWDLNGNQIRRLSGHTDYVTSVSLARDGNLIFSTSWDKTARIWTREGELITILRGPFHQEEGAIAPDGSYAFSGMRGRTGILWPMPQTVYKWLKQKDAPIPSLTESELLRLSNILGSQHDQAGIQSPFQKGEPPK